ncbi:MAG: helix-turn-helix transcriptional regulator [Devosiaceae bacterium]
MSNSNELLTDLARLRKDKGYTQAQLAQAVGVSRKTINTVENSVFVPSTVLALKLAQELDVSVHDLFVLNDKGA